MKLSGKDDAVLAVYPAIGNEWVSLYTKQTRLLCFPVSEITLVRGAGKGVIAIKMDAGDTVEGFELTRDAKSGLIVKTDRGRELTVHPKKYGGSRAAKGNKLLQRGSLGPWTRQLLRLDKMFNFTKDNPEASSEEGSSVSSVSSSSKESVNPVASPVPPVTKPQRPPNKRAKAKTATASETVEKTPTTLFPNLPDSTTPKPETTSASTNAETTPKQRKKPKIVVRANYPSHTQHKLF